MIVSLADMKTYLGISGTDDDAFLTEQLQLISDTVEAYCRRKFEEVEVEETFYGTDYLRSNKLTLFHFPVQEIASITEDDEDPLDADLYRLNKPTGIVTRPDNAFHVGVTKTVVAYTAGYADGEIPTPVTSTVKSLVQERYNKKKAGIDLSFGSDVQRLSIPGVMSIDFDYSLQNNQRESAFGVILGNYVNILDSYRSERTIVGEGQLVYLE